MKQTSPAGTAGRKAVLVNHFSKSTLNKLARKGITLVGLQGIPGPYGGEIAYILNDNGTHRVRRFAEVMDLAKAEAA